MNIEQIKTDLSAGVIVSPATWRKLVEAALMMQDALEMARSHGGFSVSACAATALEKVEAL